MGAVTTLEYSHGGTRLLGRLALPDGEGPHPALLVMHNAHGLGDGVVRRAEALARQGYVALATDMYGDGAYFTDPREAGPSMGALLQAPELMRARILAAFETLRGLPQVDRERVGAVGFCFGGQCVLELARSGAPARAVVSFHGLLSTQAPARPGEVKARVLVLTGAHDPYASLDQVEALRQELAAAGADHQITIYGEGWHAFTDEEAETRPHVPGVRYDPLLDRLSWAQALAFLEATVKETRC